MWLLPGTVLERVAAVISFYHRGTSVHRLGVAVSGGADSVSLLHALLRLRDELKLSLSVVHLNHRLRGEESDADEQFVRALADRYALRCFVREAPIPGAGNVEQAARELRRSFFEELRREGAIERVALGHTASDQAETVLYRLMRGASLNGLAGMQAVSQDFLVRPFLSISRMAVREWAAAEGLLWREDSSNSDLRFRRNRLRLQTMPELRQRYNARLDETLCGMAALARAEEDYWDEVLRPLFPTIAQWQRWGLILSVPSLLAQPLAIQRRLLRRAICEVKGNLRSIDFSHTEDLLRISSSEHGHDRVLLPEVDAVRSFDLLLLRVPGERREQTYSSVLRFNQWVELPSNAGRVRAEVLPAGVQSCDNLGTTSFEAEESATYQTVVDARVVDLTGSVSPRLMYIRSWQPGDAIRRTGHRSAEKLKDLFGKGKVPLWERASWPVVTDSEGAILWTRRFGFAQFDSAPSSPLVLRLLYQTAQTE